jgi:acetoin utilization deacetylase AcuC-like enzyme
MVSRRIPLYPETMSVALYTHPDMLDHRPREGHPERPERLAAVCEALSQLDLAVREAPPVEPADLALVHGEQHLRRLEAFAPHEGIRLVDPDTEMSPGSLRAAHLAAGAVAEAVRAVAAGDTLRAFCAVRPPGHHAGPGFAMGFCLLSNIAIGARVAQGCGLARVAVADFDVHHGNGTQAVFETDPNLFFASVHESPNYPGSGAASETGVGNIANAPVPPMAPREVWRAAFEGLMERIDAFGPDIILISAGFDAHARDPLANQALEAEDYAWATRAIASVARRHCGGKLVSTLEGGYDLRGLADSTVAHVRALRGE